MPLLKPKQVIRTHLKKNLSAPGGVAEQLKMLKYYMYDLFFRCSAPCQKP